MEKKDKTELLLMVYKKIIAELEKENQELKQMLKEKDTVA